MLDQKYNPQDFEREIYSFWEKNGFFSPSQDMNKKPYTIVMPPPNITGALHMGHAIDETLQDVLIRRKRMTGFSALWIPGTDHASIATEAKIVDAMKKEGLTKADIGREKFLERAWEWKKQYGGRIETQLRYLGCSCDWNRERFTMDEGLSDAVLDVFVNLYNEGLIYKGKRMVNWCPYCKTTISDAEVEFKEEKGHLWYIQYKGADGSEGVTVATTRPETMLGDTAIAVNPNDKKYSDLIGKKVILPLMNKEIPVIADEFVETEFGTGAVKITPAHDPNDYGAALRHDLEIIEVFDDGNKMLDLIPKYQGMDVLQARDEIVKDLEQSGALLKIEDYSHNVGKCYRCTHSVEPRLSEQWFVKMKPLAEPAIQAVKSGKIKFVPARFSKIYYNWMENIQDWCISRQLWWGHRIPAYYCEDCGALVVAKEKPTTCPKCGKSHFVQDEGTLDTWFSSALWPFSTLGWPEKTVDFERYFPTNTLVTGYDIIFFWVARMIFSSLKHTNKIPFDTVLIHGLVRDDKGRKMSKSLGNGVDPIKVIDEYGADALRFALLLGTAPGNDLRYSAEKLESAKNFANKIWNASKFVLMNLSNDKKILQLDKSKLCVEDKWILSKLNTLLREVDRAFEKYDLSMALEKIYTFIWDEFCDWYIEMAKARLFDKECETRNEVQYVLNYVLSSSLKLLHPFMPFVTEKIYGELANPEQYIICAELPTYDKKLDYHKEEKFIENLKELIVSIRNARAKMNIIPSKKSKIVFKNSEMNDLISKSTALVLKLGFGTEIEFADVAPKNSTTIVSGSLTAWLALDDLIDKDKERKRLADEESKNQNEFDRLQSMLSNENFLKKAPPLKIEETRQRAKEIETILNTIREKQKELD